MTGVAIGGVSLTIQLLNGCLKGQQNSRSLHLACTEKFLTFVWKGYRLLLSIDDMPEDARFLKTRLEMEYSRFDNFRVISGLARYQDGDPLPEMLRPHKVILIAILADIEHSMNQLACISGDFEELRSDTIATNGTSDEQLANWFSQVSFGKPDSLHEYWTSLNHWLRLFHMTGNAVKYPRRIKWAALKRKEFFDKFLGRLVDFNTYLEGLVERHEANSIVKNMQNLYLEMVQVRSTVQELVQLNTAATLFLDNTAVSSRRRAHVQMLASLVQIKCVRVSTDADDGQRPSLLEFNTQKTEIASSLIQYDQSISSQTSQRTRFRIQGSHKIEGLSQRSVWIEWKPYRLVPSEHDHDSSMPSPKNTQRVKELVALLQSVKDDGFCAPSCLGWFDDRDEGKKNCNPSRFGLVFENPTQGRAPTSLYELVQTYNKPSLTDRIALSRRIAKCVLYLHAVSWLHKGLRSDSIIFVPTEDKVDITCPYVTGYDYARPDKDDEATVSTTGEDDLTSQLYVHPNYQGRLARGTYRKTFDIYSLGMLLLEIAYWMHVKDMLKLGAHMSEEEVKSVRANLLMPENQYMMKLKQNFGIKFGEVVHCCLQGREAFDIAEGERESDPVTGAKLQQAFIAKVVEPLDEIQL